MSDTTKTTISFNDLPAGTLISDQFADQGVTVTSSGTNPAMIFDATQDPAGPVSGDDTDLLNASAGGILIASEDGDSSDPDDAGGGATLGFHFDSQVIFQGITLADVEEGATITIRDADGRLLYEESFTSADGEYLDIEVDVPGAVDMEIVFAGSGGIDDLIFTKAIAPDGIVNGTAEGELIDADFVDADGDVIDGGDAIGVKGTVGDDDFVTASDGNDTVFAGEGNDLVRGEKGDDLLFGEAGMDTLTGGLGDDTAFGGDGMDEIIMFDGDDSASGGDGNDWMWGGDGSDTLSGNDGDDMISGEGDDDTIFGGSGDDTLDGGDGDDKIFGDSDPEGNDDDQGEPICGDRESFNWAEVAGFANRADAGDVTQNTGTVDVTFSVTDVSGSVNDRFETDAQFTDGIDGGDETVDDDASFSSILRGEDSAATYDFAFSSLVKNVSFNVTDIDRDSIVSVKAFDAEGNEVPVSLTGGSELSVEGDTATSLGGSAPDSTADFGLNVEIEGVASRVEIMHAVDGDRTSGINLTDLFFDPVTGFTGDGTATEGGDDIITGGAGDDMIDGEGGDDSISGDDGDDMIDGGDGDDTITGGSGNDTLTGGDGMDMIDGGDDKDVIVGADSGDMIDGGEGGDDYDTLDLTGVAFKKIDFTSDDREDGIITFDDHTTAKFEEIEKVIPCFTPGTLIATPRGEIAVEDLELGDRVITRDNGIQAIRWIGRKDLSAADMVVTEAYRPVMIRKGALGHGLPERDMIVSPQHRVLVVGDETLLYFEEREVLVAAKHLVGRPGIERMAPRATAYIHVMFDAHQVILSDGAWTESFQPGDASLAGLGDAQREELLSLFPELRDGAGREGYVAARRSLKRREAELLSR
ncbi:Hint domain-containing protein [Jannaschia sp.]|nr:Hint domain-containing protein [Jannaschia sp.]